MATPLSRLAAPQHQRPGPKIAALATRQFMLSAPTTTIKRTYSTRRKIEVLLWLLHYRINDPEARDSEHYVQDGCRRPYVREASKWFQIPERTIHNWWTNRDSFEETRTNSPRPYWPELEERLWADFTARREEGHLVRTGWFRQRAQELFQELYPTVAHDFTFSEGWFNGFKRRWNIVPRRITKQASKLPAEYAAIASKFLRFIRRVSQPIMQHLLTRFPLSRIINFDETPIPFEYLDGVTYDTKGVHTVAGKTDRSGWSKRQATLILYIFADGVHRIKPTIIFHGCDGKKGKISKKEKQFYSDEVEVHYNSAAYNNEDLMCDWLNRHFRDRADSEPYLLVMDVATFHKTPKILALLKELNIVPAMIPPGCTGMLQPLDTAINAPFKTWLRNLTEIYVAKRVREEKESGKVPQPWSVSDKRVMTTHVVKDAIEILKDRSDMVKKAFLDVGISIKPDGSEDHLINIKDIRPDQIDWSGWQTENQNDIIQPEPSHDDVDFIEGPVPDGWSFTDQLLADDDYMPPSLPKSTKVKGKRKSLTGNSAPKRAQKVSQKKAKGKPTVDKENMSPEMIVPPENPSAVKRTVSDAKGKGVIHFR
ncbi:uncharacterized protein CPUR_08764 [Claviceps purpurea 20.1]|uniref:HTH CENPB-type domain-containing protein n=1 Tax=Claviceps purpurea (strain 20.1) TaxID=1111077 RepID=M1WDI6_CLAP2|nr:uncharacterized protein CPUR_08764 [Claviceps purpurea 20.1]